MILMSFKFFIPLRQLGSYFHIAMNGIAASDKIFKILDLPIDQQKEQHLQDNTFPIEVRDLSFSYQNDRPILKNISFSIQPHQFIGIVGESGSRKSTIARLIMGHYQQYDGKLLIQNRQRKELDDYDFFNHFIYVNHEPMIFQGTVRDNLCLKPNTSPDNIEKVLKQVCLFDYFHNQNGLETLILENGSNLSRGQKQRLHLARTLLQDSDVYIFDEATSNIDVESENMIFNVIKQLAKEKTVIMITHRLSQVISCDHILVFNQRQIIQQAHHEQLIKLVKPLSFIMCLAIIMGVLGFLCAIGIPVFSSLALLRGVFHYLEQVANHYIAFKILAITRDHVFLALRRLCPAKLDNKEKGNLISLITHDIELLEVFYAHTISPVVIALMISVIMLVIFYHLHYIIMLIALIAYLFIGFVIPLYVDKRQAGENSRNQIGHFSSYILEIFRGLNAIIQFHLQNNRQDNMTKQNEDIEKQLKAMKDIEAKQIILSQLFITFFSLLMFFVSYRLYQMHLISIYKVIMATITMLSSFSPVLALSSLSNNLLSTFCSGKRVIALSDEEELIFEVRFQKESSFDNINIKNISFAYEDDLIFN